MILPVRQIFQEMAAERLRLGLTILAVAWATLCITSMLAIGEGLRQGVIRAAQSGNGNLIYLTGGMATMSNGTFHQGQALKIHSEDAEVISALPGVKLALSSAQWDERLSVGDRTSWGEPYAVRQDYQAMTGLDLLPGGRWFNPLDVHQRRKVIVLGYSKAADLFNPEQEGSWFSSVKLKADPVGKTLKLGEEEFVVIGVLKKSSASVEQGYPVDDVAFVPFETWRRFHSTGDISAINIEPIPGIDRVRLLDTLRQVIARKYGASPNDPDVVQAHDRFLEQKSMQSFLIGLQGFLGIIGFVTLAVAGLGIANVMYATVKRSTKDIGVRMAVGATPMAIRWHYILQSMLTMMMGGCLGILLTTTLVEGISRLDFSGNNIYERLGEPKPELSWVVVAIVIATLVVIGIAAAWLPAHRAAKVTPLEALQSE